MHRNEILTRINDGVIIALSNEVRQGRFLQKKEAAIRQLTFQRFIAPHFSCIHYVHENSWRCTVYKSYIVIFVGFSVPNQTCILLNCAIDIKHLVL